LINNITPSDGHIPEKAFDALKNNLKIPIKGNIGQVKIVKNIPKEKTWTGFKYQAIMAKTRKTKYSSSLSK
jgi:hypothetical protein